MIAGCADLIVATEGSSLGMGGPAMIAGGGLGAGRARRGRPGRRPGAQRRRRRRSSPTRRRRSRSAGRCSAYFGGAAAPGPAPDQDRLRDLVPERERRAYKVQPIVETLADEGSVTFLRERFAPEMVDRAGPDRGAPGRASSPTARCTWRAPSRARAPTRPRASCSSATRSGCPVVSLVDTPGMMVGPKAEATGLVRHASRLLVAGAALRVPARRGHPAPRLRPRRAGDDRGQPARAAADRRLAQRPPRPDGPGGRGPPRRCARSSRRSRTTPSASSACARSRPPRRRTPGP